MAASSVFATHSLPLDGSQVCTKRGRNCYVPPAFLEAQKRAEMLRNPCVSRETFIQIRWLTAGINLAEEVQKETGCKTG